MLELIGTLAICAACLWLVCYLLRFWQFRQSITILERLAIAVKVKGDLVSANMGSDAAEKTYLIAACLKGIAASLTYGRIANPAVADTQFQVLQGMIASPDDIAFYMDSRNLDAVVATRLALIRARDSFAQLYQALGVIPAS